MDIKKNDQQKPAKRRKTMKPALALNVFILALTMALLGATSTTFAADTLDPSYSPDPVRDNYNPDTGTYYTTEPETTRSSAPGSSVSDKPMSYMVLKGGAYVPSDDFDLGRLDLTNPNARDSYKSDYGFSGEIAVGRYLLPMLAVEIGAGYFQSKAFSSTATSTMLRVIPIVATGKVFLPLGVFEPYGLFGIGGYISDLDVKNDGRDAFKDPEVTFGFHAGAGFNINFTPRTFIGLEGKYLWVEPEFGGDDVKIDGFITTANLGFRF